MIEHINITTPGNPDWWRREIFVYTNRTVFYDDISQWLYVLETIEAYDLMVQWEETGNIPAGLEIIVIPSLASQLG